MIPAVVEELDKHNVKIFRMSTLDLQNNPVMWVSAYLVDGLLIDCGHHHAKDEFIKHLKSKSVERCVLSHHHEDHIGACYDLINKEKVPVYATNETAFLVRMKIRIPSERSLVWGLPHPFIVKPLTSTSNIETSSASFKIVRTPGHCRNLISIFQEKEGLLFSTDAFISEKQSVIFNWEDALTMMDSLNKLLALKPKYIFLESGDVITSDKLEVLLNTWHDIKEKSEQYYSQNLSLKRIVVKLFGKESPLKTLTGGDMSRENLIRSLLGLPPVFKNRFRKKANMKPKVN